MSPIGCLPGCPGIRRASVVGCRARCTSRLDSRHPCIHVYRHSSRCQAGWGSKQSAGSTSRWRLRSVWTYSTSATPSPTRSQPDTYRSFNQLKNPSRQSKAQRRRRQVGSQFANHPPPCRRGLHAQPIRYDGPPSSRKFVVSAAVPRTCRTAEVFDLALTASALTVLCVLVSN